MVLHYILARVKWNKFKDEYGNDIENKYCKNAILKGMNLEDGGTTIDRNRQIGGHRE